jgi:hypothetical protein
VERAHLYIASTLLFKKIEATVKLFLVPVIPQMFNNSMLNRFVLYVQSRRRISGYFFNSSSPAIGEIIRDISRP